jgi:hypothetical protein
MTCAAVEMSTGMLLRCGARRRSPLKSSNIARLRIFQRKARSERPPSKRHFLAEIEHIAAVQQVFLFQIGMKFQIESRT